MQKNKFSKSRSIFGLVQVLLIISLLIVNIFSKNLYLKKVYSQSSSDEYLVNTGYNSGQFPNHCGFTSRTVNFNIDSLESIEKVELYGRGDNVLNFVMNGRSLGPTSSIPSDCEERQNMGNFERVYNVSVGAKSVLRVGANTLVAIAGNGYDPAELDFTFRIKLAIKPWIYTLDSTAFVKKGFTKLKIPVGNFTVPVLGITSTPNFLSKSLILKKEGPIPPTNVSTLGYDSSYNIDILEARNLLSSFENIKEKLDNISGLSTFNLTASTLSGNISTITGRSKNTYSVFTKEGNLTLERSTLCDIQGIFFINGNLNIKPDFTNIDYANGCIFFINGNINILSPSGYTPSSNGEKLELMLVSTGTITVGNATNTSQLVVLGSVFANILDLDRTFNGGNVSKPSFVVKYDPRYKMIFSDLLEEKTYSIREKI